MVEEQMDGLVFSRDEFLVLMDAMKPSTLVGLDTETILPPTQTEHQQLVLSGIDKLTARGLLDTREDVNVLNPELAMMARVFAYPQLVVLVLRNDPGVGGRRFSYYQAGQYIVEFTQPTADTFRFAAIPNTLAMLNRIAFVLPLGQAPSAVDYSIALDLETLLTIQQLVANGEAKKASDLLNESVDSEAKDLFFEAMTAPEFDGTIAYLRVEENRIIDGYNLAALQSTDSSWLMQPSDINGQTIEIGTCTEGEFERKLFDSLSQFIESSK